MIYVTGYEPRKPAGKQPPKRLVVDFPKSEPPLESSFVFPGDQNGVPRGRRKLEEKETEGSVSENRRAAFAIF